VEEDEKKKIDEFMEAVVDMFQKQETRMGEIESVLDHFVENGEQETQRTRELIDESRTHIDNCRRMIDALRQSCREPVDASGLPEVFPI
jgi:hypothetical protein